MPLSWWEKRLDSPLDRLLGAFDAEALAGIVGLAFEPREKARHKVTLFGMYVNRAYQQQGMGRQLVEAALAEARQHPRLKLIQLTVTAGNDAAFALYQRCGFIQYGLEPLAVRVGSSISTKSTCGANSTLTENLHSAHGADAIQRGKRRVLGRQQKSRM